MQFPINIGLHRSRILGWLFVVLAVLTCGFVWLLPFSPWVCALLTASLALLALYSRRLSQPGFALMRLQADGRLQLVDGDEVVAAEVLPEAFVHPWLCIFSVRTEDAQVLRMVFTVDSLSTVNFRHLRVWLRYQAKFSGSDAGA